MQADSTTSATDFVAGLLDPAAPVPKSVRNQAPRRYAVYRNNVTISLIRAMESNFPVVRRLLGEQYFAGLAREFVQKHPPTSPLMFQYGKNFSEYLADQQDLRDYPYLGDIAMLEQQMRLSYHEADAPTLPVTALGAMSETELMLTVFKPHPAMAIIASKYAIHSIYRANASDRTNTVEDVLTPETVLVVRPIHDVELHLINRTQSEFLNSLVVGRTLGAAADSAFATSSDFDLTEAIGLVFLPGVFQTYQIQKD